MAVNFDKNIPRNSTMIVYFDDNLFYLMEGKVDDPFKIKTFVNGGVGCEGWDQEVSVTGKVVGNNVSRKILEQLKKSTNADFSRGVLNAKPIEILLDVNSTGTDSILPEGALAYVKSISYEVTGTGEEVYMNLELAVWVPIDKRGEFTVGEQPNAA